MPNPDDATQDQGRPEPASPRGDNPAPAARSGGEVPEWVKGVLLFLLFLVACSFKASLDGKRQAQQAIGEIEEQARRDDWRAYEHKVAREAHEREQARVQQTMKEFDQWQIRGGRDSSQFLMERSLRNQ